MKTFASLLKETVCGGLLMNFFFKMEILITAPLGSFKNVSGKQWSDVPNNTKTTGMTV